MSAGPTGFAAKGSQSWLQIAVNRKPEILLESLRKCGAVARGIEVTWSSPLKDHNFCEYRDGKALQEAGILPASLKKPLADFWPARGPVWDAIGFTSEGHSLFVEAKAHIPEAASPGTRATPESLKVISKSLCDARAFFAPKATATWSDVFYQYANRLAHRYFLTKVNGLTSALVFLYFVNAADMEGPLSEEEWRGATRLVHAALGLPKELTRFGVFDAFLDVRALEQAVESRISG